MRSVVDNIKEADLSQADRVERSRAHSSTE